MAQPPLAAQTPRRSGALLEHFARRIRMRAETVLAPFGLRPRHLIALTVLRTRGSSTQQSLAQILEMDGTNVVGLLNDLEASGLVERRRSPEDRRRHVVVLTERGTDELARAEAALAGVEDEVFAALDREQREQLYGLLFQAASGTTGSGMCAGETPAC